MKGFVEVFKKLNKQISIVTAPAAIIRCAVLMCVDKLIMLMLAFHPFLFLSWPMGLFMTKTNKRDARVCVCAYVCACMLIDHEIEREPSRYKIINEARKHLRPEKI